MFLKVTLQSSLKLASYLRRNKDLQLQFFHVSPKHDNITNLRVYEPEVSVTLYSKK